ncbi:hypothetical protein KEM48_012341 [Puccinia striiformis f. sp. tritici PST-130]|nr:hypothetical protein KEM48_012341 [Puccinia striiformis f. sp. tritici PST-130]
MISSINPVKPAEPKEKKQQKQNVTVEERNKKVLPRKEAEKSNLAEGFRELRKESKNQSLIQASKRSTKTRLKRRTLAHHTLQDYLADRYVVRINELYAIIRKVEGNGFQSGNDWNVPLIGDWVLFGVIGQKSDFKNTTPYIASQVNRLTTQPQSHTPSQSKKLTDKNDDQEVVDELNEELARDDQAKQPKEEVKKPKPKKFVTFKLIDMSSNKISSSGSGVIKMILFESDSQSSSSSSSSGGGGGDGEKSYRGGKSTIIIFRGPTTSPIEMLTITPENHQSIIVIGRSKDLGSCVAKRIDTGTLCNDWCDLRNSTINGNSHEAICDFHLQRQIKKVRANRAEFFSGTSGMVQHTGKKFGHSSKDTKNGLLPATHGLPKRTSINGQITYICPGKSSSTSIHDMRKKKKFEDRYSVPTDNEKSSNHNSSSSKSVYSTQASEPSDLTLPIPTNPIQIKTFFSVPIILRKLILIYWNLLANHGRRRQEELSIGPRQKKLNSLENDRRRRGVVDCLDGQLGQAVHDLQEVEGLGLGPGTIDDDDDDLIICATLNNNSKTTTYYSESKSSKRALEEDSEYISSTSKHHHHHQQKKKYRRSNLHQQKTKKTKNHQKIINPISSPIFNNNSHATFSLPRNNRYQSSSAASNDHHHQLIELETQIKIDKLILAYKNILDAVYPSTTTKAFDDLCKSDWPIHRTINRTRNAFDNLSGNLDDDDEDHTSISLFTEADWKTSVMDEWYDAIPLLYRRYALAQHALTMILRAFPSLISNNNHSKRNSISVNHTYQPKLIHALHHLHLNYYHTPLIQSQAILLLDHLLHSLNTKTWFEIYDDYHHKFNLNLNFIELFTNQILKDLRFLEILRILSWLDSWIKRLNWRKESKRSHDGQTEDEEEQEEEQVIIEYDRQSSPIILRWINSLVTACLPNSIHCLNARRQLNGISRLLFDSFMAHTSSTTTDDEAEEECSAQDNYFLGLLTIIIESHRLTILGLPMFNTGSVSIRRSLHPPQNTPEEGEEEWCSGHTPMRLQLIIGKLELPKFKKLIEMKIYNKSAKLFFRSHRTTQLLAILPGLLSSTTRDSEDEYRNRSIIPGLDQLLNSVINGDYPLERVAKSWVQSLLQSDPVTWWSSNSSPSSTPSVDGLNDPSPSHDSNKAAHNVRICSSVEEEEEGDHGEDEDDHHGSGLNSRLEEEEEEHVIDQSDDNKPDPLQLICTCPHLPSLPEQTEEEEDKPEIGEEAEEPTVMKTKSSTKTSQVRVVIPVVPKQSPHRKKRRSKVSSRLSLPSTRLSSIATIASTSKPRLISDNTIESSVGVSARTRSATRNSLVTPVMLLVSLNLQMTRSKTSSSSRHHRHDVDEDADEDDFDVMDLLAPVHI